VSGQQTTRCWECEAVTAEHMTVALRIRERQVARLVLCERCFDMRYVPLASRSEAERGELVIAPAS
jgi:RNase P subunit RPR2